MRTFLVAANWKMNKTPAEGLQFVEELLPQLQNPLHVQVILFPTILGSAPLAQKLQEIWKTRPELKKSFHWGAQNAHYEKNGAFTGETSMAVLQELGAKYVLVGHSERRTLFGEEGDLLAKKVATAQTQGLTPMLCVGETLEQRDKGQAKIIIEQQLKAGLARAQTQAPITIAYEPVWAIGTGRVAEPQQAEEVHQWIRAWLQENWGVEISSNTSILYGGSVSPQNARELSQKPNIDGFLVGGASLKSDSFSAIIHSKGV